MTSTRLNDSASAAAQLRPAPQRRCDSADAGPRPLQYDLSTSQGKTRGKNRRSAAQCCVGGARRLMKALVAQPTALLGLLTYGVLLASRDARLPPTKKAAASSPQHDTAPTFEEPATLKRKASAASSVVVQICNA